MTLSIVHQRIVLAAALSCAGCGSPFSEAGLAVPKDPGTVVVSVRDQAGAPIPDANVQVHDIPNSVGSTYSVGQRTNSAGVVTISAIPAGRRRVEVTPPAGFSAGADGLIKEIEVVKDASVTVVFVLVRG